MKLYIHFKITESPWGGGNSFLKAFRNYCLENNIQLAKSLNEDYDILFFNAASKAPGVLINTDELIYLKHYGISNKWRLKIYGPKKKKILVYRSDGFRDEYTDSKDNIGDTIQRMSLQIADHVVFQNNSCLKSAKREHIGYVKKNYSIIYNGVNQNIFRMRKAFWDGRSPLKVISANWSKNLNKGYKLIAAFSKLPGVSVTFCGNWPSLINPCRVSVLPAVRQEKLAEIYREHDVLLHPSYYDQSPNVCIEAISCGLPIIYHATSGIREIAGEFGMPLDEDNLLKTAEQIKNQYQEVIDKITVNRSFFSMERCALQYIELFNNILSKNHLR